jgi:hypothetical protein
LAFQDEARLLERSMPLHERFDLGRPRHHDDARNECPGRR